MSMRAANAVPPSFILKTTFLGKGEEGETEGEEGETETGAEGDSQP